MPLSLSDHQTLQRYSTRGKRGPVNAWDRGFSAGFRGEKFEVNPEKRTGRGHDTRARVAWGDGWEEGAATRNGELTAVLKARMAESELR